MRFLARPVIRSAFIQEVTAANQVGYRAMRPAALRDMLANPAIALGVTALMAEVQRRIERRLTAIIRFEALERLSLFLLDIYDRLRRRDLIARPTFNLPLTQLRVADHLGMTMVHVNRTLRRLRQEKLAIVAQQVVMITDLDRLRAVVAGMPSLGAPFESTAELASYGTITASELSIDNQQRRA
jgi:hypothetical protein